MPFESTYSDEQRAAVAAAVLDRGVKPHRRVAELAAAGELTHAGEKLEPFTMPVGTVADIARTARRRRAGELTSELATLPPRDAIEALRRRLVNVCDAELGAEEKKKDGTRDPERLRQLARAIREAAAIPGPTDPRPPAPGAKVDGTRNGAETRGGMAGAILASHRRQPAPEHAQAEPAPAPTPYSTDRDARDTARSNATHDTHDQQHTHTDTSPGSLVREQAEALGLQIG